MKAKNLQLAKNISWGLAAVGMFVLLLENRKNNLLTGLIFILIIAGIIFSALHDKKAKH